MERGVAKKETKSSLKTTGKHSSRLGWRKKSFDERMGKGETIAHGKKLKLRFKSWTVVGRAYKFETKESKGRR